MNLIESLVLLADLSACSLLVAGAMATVSLSFGDHLGSWGSYSG